MAITLFSKKKKSVPSSQCTSESREFYREWDRARAAASTPQERAEIDAIFARHDATSEC